MTISERSAGAMLALAGVMLIVIIVDYISTMSGLRGVAGAPTPAEVAAYASTHYDRLALGWHFEILAMAMLGAAALTLMDRVSRVGWALVAIGVAVVAPMYAIMIGGYGAVFSSEPINVQLYSTLRAVATEIFYTGNLFINTGLAIAFCLELRTENKVLPGWFFFLAIGANVIVALTFLLTHFGILSNFTIAGPVILVAFALLSVFGGRLATKK